MGQVYLAEHTRMQRIVAIKMLPVERMEDRSAIAMFYDEVRAASRLMHPNIVTAFDAGEADGIHYLAMEYVEGQTLTKSSRARSACGRGGGRGDSPGGDSVLLHAHRAGIIHRDVKPGNLMRAADGTVKVLDLGLAESAPRPADRRARHRGNRARSDDEFSSKGRLVGNAPLHVARATGRSRSGGRPQRHLFAGGDAVFPACRGGRHFTGEYLDLRFTGIVMARFLT